MEIRSAGPSSPRVTVPRVTLLGVENPGWDEALALVAHSVFHTAGYHLYTRGYGEGEPYLAIVGDQARGLAWPYILRPIVDVPRHSAADATDVQSVYGYPGPLAWGCTPGDKFLQEAHAALAETWRQQGAVSVFTRFNPMLGNVALIPTEEGPIDSGGVRQAGQTVSVDLRLDDEILRRDFSRGLAREIAAGRRAGLRTMHDADWRYGAAFAALYTATMARLAASDFYYFAEEDFMRLRAHHAGTHLLVTLIGDEVAAAGLFLDSGDALEWHLIGSNDDYAKLSPSKVLVQDAIHWARDRGFQSFHMGGGRGSKEDSLFWFKSRFSKRRHPFYLGRWILEPGTYAELTEQRRAMVPAGSHLDDEFFPAYRAPIVTETAEQD